jgi:hypothetical protein
MVSESTPRTVHTRFGAPALLLVAAASCADVLDVPSDPFVAQTGPWRCLNETATTPAAAVSEAQVRVRTCDFISDCTTDVTGLTARLCDKRDVGCNQPRLADITDVNGEFRFSVPTAGGGFDGYLLVHSGLAFCTDSRAFGNVAGPMLCGLTSPQCDMNVPDDRCNITLFAPAMLFFNPPIVRDVERPVPLQMFPSAGLPTVIAAAGIETEATSGNLFIQALDCDGMPASGVRFEVAQHKDLVSPLYVDNGVVSTTTTHTDSTGIGGFVRVPPGFVTVVGYNSEDVAIGEIGVQAAPSTLTYGTIFPAP